MSRAAMWVFLFGNALQVWRHRLAYHWHLVNRNAPTMQTSAWWTLWQRGYLSKGDWFDPTRTTLKQRFYGFMGTNPGLEKEILRPTTLVQGRRIFPDCCSPVESIPGFPLDGHGYPKN